MHCNTIEVGASRFANNAPLVAIAGVNVLESASLVDEVAAHCVEVCRELGAPLVFKGSFDKANRSSIHSFRGPGMQTGLKMLADVKGRHGVPVITDLHEPHQAAPVAEVADILQLPAFLSRQTDLVVAMAKTGKPIHVKKAQFLAPGEMQLIIDKCTQAGNNKVLLCERGTSFGYHNLVVDLLGFDQMKATGAPLVFDVTHSLQLPGAGSGAAGGRGGQALGLAKAGVAQSIAGVFVEMHPEPEMAKCDGPSALRMADFKEFLRQLCELDRLVKSQPPLTGVA